MFSALAVPCGGMNAFTELHGWMHRVFRSGESITPAIRLVWEHSTAPKLLAVLLGD